MKSTINTAYCENAVFEAADLPKPDVKPGHVVVRVAESSVNTVDTMIRAMGADLPLSPALPVVLGMDFAGVVDAVGDGVTGFAAGDEVYGCAGGLADLQGARALPLVKRFLYRVAQAAGILRCNWQTTSAPTFMRRAQEISSSR